MKNNNSNVIQFPREIYKNSNPLNSEEKEQIMESVRTELSEEIGDQIMQSVISLFHTYGLFDDIEELNIKDAIFLEESIKSAVYRYKGLGHHLHDMVDELIVLPDEQEVKESSEEELTDESENYSID